MANVYPEDKWAQVNGLNLHYLDWGGDTTKKPLILMHGIGGHAHMFDEFAPHMTDRWRVIALDARGCGDSEWSRGGYSTQAFASDIGLFAQKLGLFPFDYYGHSQGSRIGIPLGAYYGNLIDHLVLGDYGPLPDPSPRGRDTAAQRLQSGAKPKPKGFFNSQMAYDWYSEQNPAWSDEQIWRTIRNTHRTNWDGILVAKTDPEMSWLLGRTALKEGPVPLGLRRQDFLQDAGFARRDQHGPRHGAGPKDGGRHPKRQRYVQRGVERGARTSRREHGRDGADHP